MDMTDKEDVKSSDGDGSSVEKSVEAREAVFFSVFEPSQQPYHRGDQDFLRQSTLISTCKN